MSKEKCDRDEGRELDKSQIIWVMVSCMGFIPSVDGGLLENFEKGVSTYHLYFKKGYFGCHIDSEMQDEGVKAEWIIRSLLQ